MSLALRLPDQSGRMGLYVVQVRCDCCAEEAPAVRRFGPCQTHPERETEAKAAAKTAGAMLYERGWLSHRHAGVLAHACPRCAKAGPDMLALCKCAGHAATNTAAAL